MAWIKEVFYKLLIQIFPTESVFYVYYGLFLENQGRLIDASNLLNYALQQKDMQADFHFYNNLGYYALKIFQRDGENVYLRIANDALTCAEKLDSQNEILLLNWAAFFQTTQDFKQMHETLLKMLQKNPKDADIIFKLGMSLLALKIHEEAGERFLDALNLAEHADLWSITKCRLGYALALDQNGQRNRAGKVVTVAITVVYSRFKSNTVASLRFLKKLEAALVDEFPAIFTEKTLGIDFKAELDYLKSVIEKARQERKKPANQEPGEEFDPAAEEEDEPGSAGSSDSDPET